MASGLFRRSLAAIAGAALAATLFTAGAALRVMRTLYDEANSRDLGEAAQALAAVLPDAALGECPTSASPVTAAPLPAKEFVRRAASGSHFRLTLIDTEGRVIADSGAEPERMENHGQRPEVLMALRGQTGTARRTSRTVGMELFYAAAPVLREGKVQGVLRIAADLPALESRLGAARLSLGLAALLAALLSLVAAALYSRHAATPLARLAAAADAYLVRSAVSASAVSASAVSGRPESAPLRTGFLVGEGPAEIRVLGRSLDAMARELAARVAEAEAEGRERRALLDGMAEAVLGLDAGLRVRLANPAAAALFGLSAPEEALGKSLLEASHSSELEKAAEEALMRAERLEAEIALYGEGERWFQAVISPLDASANPSTSAVPASAVPASADAAKSMNPRSGLVIVLNDITRLRRLERVRKDFVANVSHELRTPVQLVKGFAEGLRGGAMSDPVRAERFLSIIERNAARMESLIEDLLSLARLEQDGRGELPRERTRLREVLEAARDAVLPRAEAKGIEISIDCDERLEGELNAGLVEQAVANLLDNAVKYSPETRPVRVVARKEEDPALGTTLVIEVRDRGYGIPARDLPRIFERFYRVDKGRSRELGGTGLGLAIVRHVALAHGGEASVESFEGEGSRFILRLPAKKPSP